MAAPRARCEDLWVAKPFVPAFPSATQGVSVAIATGVVLILAAVSWVPHFGQAFVSNRIAIQMLLCTYRLCRLGAAFPCWHFSSRGKQRTILQTDTVTWVGIEAQFIRDHAQLI